MTDHALLRRPAWARDAKVLSLISGGHFFAHFYVIVLPPLFPLLHGEWGVSYAALGGLLTAVNVATAAVQVPMGFLVDRYGARRLLIIGLSVMSLAVALAGLAGGYWMLLSLMLLMGAGNSVFHPADYAILSSKVSHSRLGRAFSVHTFAGHVGWAVAPGCIILLTALASWQTALLVVGLAGFVMVFLLILFGRVLEGDVPEALPPAPVTAKQHRPGGHATGPDASLPPDGPHREGWSLLLSAPMLLFFLYMVLAAVATGGLNGFTVVALTKLYDAPLEAANLALTMLLVTSALGVLLGGVLADRTRHHDRILIVGFLLCGAALVLVGAGTLGTMAVILAIALAGLCQGAIRPSRDMMVRAAAPAGSVGKVFGFVTMGMNVGGAIAPILFGWVLDQGYAGTLFYLAALAMIGALGAALLANRRAQIDSAAAREGEP
ncbi:MAG: MFS transporter [Pseudomonadota bacterium]